MGNIVSYYSGGKTGTFGTKARQNSNTMDDFNCDETKINRSDSACSSGSDCDNKNESVDVVSRKLSPLKEKELEEFRKQLAEKREARKKIIKEKSNEMTALKDKLQIEINKNEELLKENDRLKQLLTENNVVMCVDVNVSDQQASQTRADDNQLKLAVEELEKQVELLKDHLRDIRKELSESNLCLQNANCDLTLVNKENVELRKQIAALKDVNRFSKEMMIIREQQIVQLKDKLTLIEESLSEREMRTMSTELKQEYERQLQNIRNLRIMYEERSRLAEITRLSLVRELELRKAEGESLAETNTSLESRNKELEDQIAEKVETISSQDTELCFCKAEIRELQAEMTVINQLFSQMLMGYNPSHDLDKLVSKLEENHDLLKDVVVRGEGAEGAAALPRMLLDLLSQVDDKTSNKDKETIVEDETNAASNDDSAAFTKPTTASAQEIVGNLPKVWRVLMELLSHQTSTNLLEISDESVTSCYKSVETPSGPRLVPSVSKTYIRLKDLIVEKKTLQKETYRLKQLNTHLESRLQDQESRLSLVTSELNKTWRIVGKMQRAHQQLHTHEKILRYELQQKRKMLTELKEQLEFCKEKWDKAKQKNSQSQVEWDKLRLEFSKRKLTSVDSVNNSAESGYSDEKPSDSSDSSEDEDVSERRRTKRKTKSPEANVGKNPILKFLITDEQNDSDALQDEEDLPMEGTEILSDVDSQANLADTEDQSISEAVSVNNDNNEERNGSPAPYLQNIIQAGSEKLKKLEKKCSVLATKVEKVNNEGVALCSKLEELQNQYGGGGTDLPSTSREISEPLVSENQNNADGIMSNDVVDNFAVTSTNNQVIERIKQEEKATSSENSDSENSNQTSSTNKYIQEYEARFAARDARLKRMEEQTKSLVKKVTNTSTRGVVIGFKLDELHNVYGRSVDENDESNQSTTTNEENCSESNERLPLENEIKTGTAEQTVNTVVTGEDKDETNIQPLEDIHEDDNKEMSCIEIAACKLENEPLNNPGCSTSSTNDSIISEYEARFAARDERLKRMEEQAKSLVKQVSDTSTKSVKIEYKLDELHNIYGKNDNQGSDEENQKDPEKPDESPKSEENGE